MNLKNIGNISVLIVDDHRIVRDGLMSSLKKDEKIATVYEAATGREAVLVASKLCPDIVIMDINLPDINGIETTRRILKVNSTVKVIAFTMHKDKIHVMKMMAAGACGFLTKTCSAGELLNAVHQVVSGKICVCDEVMNYVFEMKADGGRCLKKYLPVQLTLRETQVLKLVAEGMTNGEIAGILDISTRTVETHRQNLMNKLDIRNTALLTRFAIQQGIVFLE